MKRLMTVFAAVLVLAPASLWAQDVPAAEIFGGFSVLTSKDSGQPRITPLGWQASVTANITDKFGVVGDFGGAYKSNTNCPSCKFHTFLGGVQIAQRMEKATVFAHALYGGNHSSATGGSSTDFTMGYGGGVDVRATDRISIRVIQFDWLPTRTTGGGTTNWVKNVTRYGFGVVFKTAPR